MTAIDFQSLMRQERQKSRKKATEISLASASEEKKSSSSSLPPSWRFQQPQSLYSLKSFDSDLYHICSNPPDIYYVPNVLTCEFQRQISDWLLSLPENENPNQSCSSAAHSKWTPLRFGKRRVALFDKRICPFPQPLALLADYVDKSVWYEKQHESGESFINHILINDYSSSDQGILPHTDGPAYEPCTATLSLESDALLTFLPRGSNQNKSRIEDYPTLILEPGSLVVFRDEAYAEWMHSIPTNQPCIDVDSRTCVNLSQTKWAACSHQDKVSVQRGTRRISLTFRVAR